MMTYSYTTANSTASITYCLKCGRAKESATVSGDLDIVWCTCDIEPLQGWTCPSCGRGVSPFETKCNHCEVDYTAT